MEPSADSSTAGQTIPTDLPTQFSSVDPLAVRKILVATDLSEESFRAFEFALLLARRFDAKLHVAFVYDPHAPQFAMPPEITRRLQHEAKDRFSHSLLPSECHVRSGRPFQEIISAAEELDAGLIVLATTARDALPRLLLGGIAEKAVRHTNRPVLIVPAEAKGPATENGESMALRKILVPVDFSDCAKKGARYASAFATRIGADLQLIHVIEPPCGSTSNGTAKSEQSTNLILTKRLEAEDKLDDLVNSLPLVNINAATQVELSSPTERIAQRAQEPDIDMVITSTHGNGAARHLLLGSVAEQLIRTAHCPILIVPNHRH